MISSLQIIAFFYIIVQAYSIQISANFISIRLVGGKKKTEGRVEILHKGIWGTICDDNWDDNDARIICHMLGYSGGKAHGIDTYGAGNGTIWLDEVKCSGKEDSINDCVKNAWGQHDCKHEEDAGVSCVSASGPTYIRWGRRVCPETAELVYEGRVAGTHHRHTGGASNHLCLPKDPLWGLFTDTQDSRTAYVFGAEYQMNIYKSGEETAKFSELHQLGVPCALCQMKEPGTVIMLPARNRCYSGWTLEYSGYLMADRHDHKRSTYECIDNDPEVEKKKQSDGARLYTVRVQCGSLKCPPYVHNRELTCAVCSK